MIVTDIKPGRREEILVYVDGHYLLSMPREVFLKMNLKVGCELSQTELENINLEIDSYKAKSKALNLLSYRSHSKKELEKKLGRTFGEEGAKNAADKMEKIGLLNDENYAKEYAYHLAKNKMYASKRIAFELSKKGIDSDIISAVIDDLEIDQEQNIEKILRKKPIKSEKDKRRVIAYLMRLGYTWSQISHFVE